MMTVGGPMFEPAQDRFRCSVHGKSGGHYNVFVAGEETAVEFLRHYFPDGEADELNFVLFSTSGIHGSYLTIGAIEESLKKYPNGEPEGADDGPYDYVGDEITFLLVQPRIVSMTYGNAKVTLADIPFLRKLQESSWEAVGKIGARG